MMRKVDSLITRPSAFGLTLGLLLCMGAAAHGSVAVGGEAGSLTGRLLERPTVSGDDEEAIASLLACLSHAARQLQPTPPQAALAPPHRGSAALLWAAPVPPPPQDRRVISRDLPLTRLNLPPPTAC